MIGEPILRRNSGYPDEPQQWIKTICNETYLELMKEFPEDYRGEDGSKILINVVKCAIINGKAFTLKAHRNFNAPAVNRWLITKSFNVCQRTVI